MKPILLLIVLSFLIGCKKDSTEPDRIFKVSIISPAFTYSISSGGSVVSSSTTAKDQVNYEFTPEVGKTVNVKVNATGTIPVTMTVTYKGQNLEMMSCNTGNCTIDKNYQITN